MGGKPKDASEKKILRWVFWLTLLVILVTRFVLLWNSTLTLQNDEELTRGILPVHLDLGLMMPVYMYQYDEYAGGGLVMGLMAYPAFKLLGPSWFALKIGGLVFSLLLFFALFTLARRFFGFLTAVMVCIVFAVPPYSYILRSLSAYGNHVETGTFMAACFALFLASRKPAGARARTFGGRVLLPLGFGVLSGFAMYFEYEYAVFLGIVGLLVWLSRRSAKEFFADTALFSVGFLVGFAPWLLFHKGITLRHYLDAFTHPGPPRPETAASHNDLSLFVQTITIHFVQWFKSRDLLWGTRILVPGWVFDVSLFTVFAGSYGYLFVKATGALRDFLKGLVPFRQPAAWTVEHGYVLMLLFIPAYVLVYALYPAPFAPPIPPFRYLMPLYPFYFLVVAIALARLWKNRHHGIVAAALVLVVFGGIGGNAMNLQRGHAGHAASLDGYSHKYFYEMLARVYPVSIRFQPYIDQVQAAFPQRNEPYYHGLAAGIAYLHGVDVDGHRQAARNEGPEAFEAFVAGLGSATGVTFHARRPRMESISSLYPPELQGAFDQGRTMAEAFRGKPALPTPFM